MIDNPLLFQQYYTYSSEVLDSYLNIDLLVTIFRVMIHKFPGTVKLLLKKYGLSKLYKMNLELMKEIFEIEKKDIPISLIDNYFMESMVTCFDEIIKSKIIKAGIPYLEEIYEYEIQLEYCREVCLGIHKEAKYPKLFKYKVNVIRQLQNC